MTAKAMKKIKDRVNANDVVITPPKIVDIMIKELSPTDSVLDPCRFKGAFYDKINNENKDWCEIQDGKDFYEHNEKCSTIIGNFPYSQLSKWLKKCYTITDKIITIIGMYSLTPARLRDAEEAGFHLTKLILTQVPTWFQRSYIVVMERRNTRPSHIEFESLYLGNKCLFCDRSVGGSIGTKNRCRRKMNDVCCPNYIEHSSN